MVYGIGRHPVPAALAIAVLISYPRLHDALGLRALFYVTFATEEHPLGYDGPAPSPTSISSRRGSPPR